MKVTIFGATGLLGKSLMHGWKDGRVRGLSSKDADLRNERQVQNAIEQTRPDWIILAAAYSDVDGCEADPERAFAVNSAGAANVARAAKESGARMLFVSTDYVFDGVSGTPYEVNHPRSPGNVYGQSKARAEVELPKIIPDICIVRTAWLFGAGGRCFPDTILKLAASRTELDVVTDQHGCPTYTIDLAGAIMQLCRQDARGIIHGTNRGECARFEFAQKILAEAGVSATVRPITTGKLAQVAERPKYSVLSPKSLEKYGITMPSWQDALKRYLAERKLSRALAAAQL